MLKALIFDVDGTLAETETAHMDAFNQAFTEANMPWHWDEAAYIQLLEVSGGKERIRTYWERCGDMPTDKDQVRDTIEKIHMLKNTAYAAAVNAGKVSMRPGVLLLLSQARSANLPVAIATTTSPANIEALLSRALGGAWRDYFQVVEDASTAPCKKPDPMVYLQALKRLGLQAQDCLAFEDSANGLRSAQAAGIATVVTPNKSTAHHDFSGALQISPSLAGLELGQLCEWHKRIPPAMPMH